MQEVLEKILGLSYDEKLYLSENFAKIASILDIRVANDNVEEDPVDDEQPQEEPQELNILNKQDIKIIISINNHIEILKYFTDKYKKSHSREIEDLKKRIKFTRSLSEAENTLLQFSHEVISWLETAGEDLFGSGISEDVLSALETEIENVSESKSKRIEVSQNIIEENIYSLYESKKQEEAPSGFPALYSGSTLIVDGQKSQIYRGIFPVPVIGEGKEIMPSINITGLDYVYELINEKYQEGFSGKPEETTEEIYTRSKKYSVDLIKSILGYLKKDGFILVNPEKLSEKSRTKKNNDEYYRKLLSNIYEHITRYVFLSGKKPVDFQDISELIPEDMILEKSHFEALKMASDKFNQQMVSAEKERQTFKEKGKKKEAITYKKNKFFCEKCNRSIPDRATDDTAYGKKVSASSSLYSGCIFSDKAQECLLSENLLRDEPPIKKSIMEMITDESSFDFGFNYKGQKYNITDRDGRILKIHSGHLENLRRLMDTHKNLAIEFASKFPGIIQGDIERDLFFSAFNLVDGMTKIVPQFHSPETGTRNLPLVSESDKRTQIREIVSKVEASAAFLGQTLLPAIEYEAKTKYANLFTSQTEEEAQKRITTASQIMKARDMIQYCNFLPSWNAVNNLYDPRAKEEMETTGRLIGHEDKIYFTGSTEKSLLNFPEAIGRMSARTDINEITEEFQKIAIQTLAEQHEGDDVEKRTKYIKDIFNIEKIKSNNEKTGYIKSNNTRIKNLQLEIEKMQENDPRRSVHQLEIRRLEDENSKFKKEIEEDKNIVSMFSRLVGCFPDDVKRAIFLNHVFETLEKGEKYKFYPDPANQDFSMLETSIEDTYGYFPDNPKEEIMDPKKYLFSGQPLARKKERKKKTREEVMQSTGNTSLSFIRRQNSYPEYLEFINFVSSIPRDMAWQIAAKTSWKKEEVREYPKYREVQHEKGIKYEPFFVRRQDGAEVEITEDVGKRFYRTKSTNEFVDTSEVVHLTDFIPFDYIGGPASTSKGRKALAVMALTEYMTNPTEYNIGNIFSLLYLIRNEGYMIDTNKVNRTYGLQQSSFEEENIKEEDTPPAVKILRESTGLKIDDEVILSKDPKIIDKFRKNILEGVKPGVIPTSKTLKPTKKKSSANRWYKESIVDKNLPKEFNFVLITSFVDCSILARNSILKSLKLTNGTMMPILQVAPFSVFGSLENVSKFSTDPRNNLNAIAINKEVESILENSNIWQSLKKGAATNYGRQ